MNVLAYRGPTTNSDGQETVNHSEHQKALRGDGLARAMRDMLKGWQHYARSHKRRYETPIGEDYVLGRYWAETGLAIKRLLDGETGGFDCGSIAANITDMIEAEGFKTDGYSLID
jgi:hypothetical protein